MAAKYNFTYDSTNNWNNLNAEFLSQYQVVLFLDTRPDSPWPREMHFKNTWKMEVDGWDFILQDLH